MSDQNREQVEIAERIQMNLLKRWDRMLSGEDPEMAARLSPTEIATISRVLLANGWNIDPQALPQKLRDKLTQRVDPKQLDEEDPDVIPFRSRA